MSEQYDNCENGIEACTELLTACATRRTSTVIRLLRQDRSLVNCSDKELQTPLIVAADCGASHSLIRALLDVKPNVDSADVRGRTALYAGIANMDLRGINALIQYGANVNSETLESETPLTASIVYRRRAVARLLLGSGANVNHTCKDGGTPLYYAVYHGHKHFVEMLLSTGASTTGVRVGGMTILEWAIDSKVWSNVDRIAKEMTLTPLGRKELSGTMTSLRNQMIASKAAIEILSTYTL